MSSEWWTFSAPSFSTSNLTVWPTIEHSSLSVTSYLFSSFGRNSHHFKLSDVFDIFFLTKCQWDLSIHCLPVLARSWRGVQQQCLTVMVGAHWVSEAPAIHRLPQGIHTCCLSGAAPPQQGHVTGSFMSWGLFSVVNSPVRPFLTTQWAEQIPSPPPPGFCPTSPSRLPPCLYSTLTFWHTVDALVCLLSDFLPAWGQGRFLFPHCWISVSRTHPGRQKAPTITC